MDFYASYGRTVIRPERIYFSDDDQDGAARYVLLAHRPNEEKVKEFVVYWKEQGKFTQSEDYEYLSDALVRMSELVALLLESKE
jgi:hypothetical protein